MIFIDISPGTKGNAIIENVPSQQEKSSRTKDFLNLSHIAMRFYSISSTRLSNKMEAMFDHVGTRFVWQNSMY